MKKHLSDTLENMFNHRWIRLEQGKLKLEIYDDDNKYITI